MPSSPLRFVRVLPGAIVCDVCQSEPALVTIGAVDYCAPCAPCWHPSFDPDHEAEAPVLELVR